MNSDNYTDIENDIVRFLSGGMSADEEADFLNLCKFNSRVDNLYKEIKLQWENLEGLDVAMRIEASTDAEWEIFRNQHFTKPVFSLSFGKQMRRFAAALIPLIIIAGLGLTYLLNDGGLSWTGYASADQIDSLYLADNSLVVLNKSSKIKYNFNNNKRQVKLNGIAYFDVEKDKTRPFIVKLDKSEVKVLGTSFIIESIKGRDRVVVEVTDGHVQFGNGKQQVIMTKGQRAILENGNIAVEGFDKESSMCWMSDRIHIKSATLQEVCNDLMKFYPQIKRVKNIESASDSVRVTTMFDHQSLEEVIDELQIHFGKIIEFKRGELIITN